MAFATMIRQNLQGENVKIVGTLKINDRLLHYVVVHWLTSRLTNFAKVMKEYIFMI